MTQTAENNSIASRSRRLFRWLLMVLCLTGIPAALVSFAVFRFYNVAEDEIKFKLKTQLQRATNEAVGNLEQEVFWCRLFYEKFRSFEEEGTETGLILAWIEEQQRLFPDEFDFIAWTPAGVEIKKTFSDENSPEEWLEVFKVLSNYPVMGDPGLYGKVGGDIEVARKIIGPQLMQAMVGSHIDPDRFSLAWLDSSLVRPPIAMYFVSKIALLLRFNQDKLAQKNGLKNSLEKFADRSGISLGLINTNSSYTDSIWYTGDARNIEIPGETFARCENESLSFVEMQHAYLGYSFLAPALRIFALIPRGHDEIVIIWRALAGAMVCLLFMLPFLIYTWQTVVAGRPGRATIKTRLAFLFIFACGIPLLAMVLISHEHYSQKRRILMADAHQSSVDKLLSFDRRFLSFMNNDAVSLDKLLNEWALQSRGKNLDIDLTVDLEKRLAAFQPGNYFVVASSSNKLINRNGLYVLKGSLDNASIDREASQPNRKISGMVESDVIAANLIAKKVMSDLNRVEIEAQVLSKLELIAESLLQQTFLEMTNSVIGNLGHVNNWGFGRVAELSFFKLLTVVEPGLTDYVTIISWRPVMAQTRFLQKAVALANRNAIGSRLITRSRLDSKYLPELASRALDLREFASRLGPKPTEEIELINLADEEYIAVGFNGHNLSFFQLIVLYPMRNIDRVIGQQKSELLLFVLFSIVLAASLAQILAKSFVEPLHALRDGALAIENREFTHRVAGVGRDEFGEVATIFNEVMVGFEELEVARIVQDSLFPPPRFEHGNFAIFGKSVSMSELGGDYFDFFVVDDQHFAVLAGDVAGHGVGAALIMAMAKAGILSSPYLLSTPGNLLLELHKMILASKSKQQKKIMTFQYLYLDSMSGVGSYSNAGGCSPMLIRAATMSVEEFTLTGSALGAFNKAQYSEAAIEFGAGDAIVFYTDGIIEARAPDGSEIGYDGFKELLQANYNPDPEVFYQNVFAAYSRHIGSSEAQDDLTLIITVCKPSD
ncbi:MAG: SpoIIE family protein phosphatase [Candidatus Riflebacteria bacterium]|nr:SpoIIE family protein phosphatase [Candidatus Riflebacteria bacterium]